MQLLHLLNISNIIFFYPEDENVTCINTKKTPPHVPSLTENYCCCYATVILRMETAPGSYLPYINSKMTQVLCDQLQRDADELSSLVQTD